MAVRAELPHIPGFKMSNVRAFVVAVALALAGTAFAAPQAPAKPQPAPAAAPAAPAATPAPGSEPPAPYAYDPRGRRDPFVSLLTRGSDPRAAATRPPGPAGVLISEASVKGIVRTRDGFLALIQGTGTKTFTVHTGEKLMDGTIKAIDAEGVVFSQDVNDPLSLVKQKEVRKTVRSSDGGRE
jgi:type IV pilus assembly protein PilP